MELDDFSRNLNLFGTDLDTWPESLKVEAKTLLAKESRCQHLLEQEIEFEELLRERKFEEPSSNFTWKIVQSAREHSQKSLEKIYPKSFLRKFKEIITPTPAIAFALVLFIGIGIGYFQNSSLEETPSSQELASLLYHEDDPLWTSDSN